MKSLTPVDANLVSNYVRNVADSIISNKGWCLLLLLRIVLRISRYSDFLSPMLTNTGIFFRGLKLSGESRS